MHKIQPFSYHMHTSFSDGQNTLEEMVAQAKKIGFTEMGVSDHLIVHKNIKNSFPLLPPDKERSTHIYNESFKSVLDKFKRHCEHIRRIAKQENFKLYVGFEVDYFTYDGWEDEFKWFVSQLDYDFLHTGNHFFCDEGGENIINIEFLRQLCPDRSRYNEYVVRHFATIRQAVESKLFKFVAHLDYARRYGADICGADSHMVDKINVLEALQKTDTALELSTKGLRKIGDFYPSQSVLKEVAERNITVIINDDAHKTDELGADFDKAELTLEKLGITNRLRF